MAELPSNDRRALSGLRLAVAGAGVLGLSIAVLAARSGAQVTVFDPRPLGANASGVAAGMLSPALEAALDPEEAEHDLLREGYLAWPAFAAAVGLAPPPALHAGALYLDDSEALDRLAERLAALGAAAERLTGAAARALQPALPDGSGEALYVAADGRADPLDLLARLADALHAAGGERVFAPAPEGAGGFDALVVAAGYDSRRWIDAAPALAALRPIKGHVLHFQGGPAEGATLRAAQGYAAPHPRGVVFGATMEAGRADLDLAPDQIARLRTAASALLPALARTPFRPLTGVRAASLDGRPLVGPVGSGLHLATGARRNGWLLAPLVARATLEALGGAAARPAFDPARFG